MAPLNSPNQRRKLGLNAPDSPNTTGTFQHIFYVVSASQAINGQMKKWLEASEEMARRQWSNFMLYGSFLVKSSRPYALDSNGRGCRCLELPETVLYCSSNQKSKYTIAIVALPLFCTLLTVRRTTTYTPTLVRKHSSRETQHLDISSLIIELLTSTYVHTRS